MAVGEGRARRALLFSVDGLRPDAISERATPRMAALIAQGAYSPSALAVMPSVTLPCHMSMLRGVDVPRHGVTTNTYQPPARPVPGLIDVAHAHGLVTGFFNNWEELRDLSAPGALDVHVMHRDCDTPEGDRLVAEVAVDWMGRLDLRLIVVYLGWPDVAGHRDGWMSDLYLAAIANADRCLGVLLDGLAHQGWARETVTLVTSDHGGHGRSHGTDCDEDMTIPWLLSGPGARRGHTIAGPVRIYDTCPTLARLLGLPHDREWDGAAVEEALTDDEA